MTVLHLENQSRLLRMFWNACPATFNERFAFVCHRRSGCIVSATWPVDRPVAVAIQGTNANVRAQRDIARV
jgi:hypothetical protein